MVGHTQDRHYHSEVGNIGKRKFETKQTKFYLISKPKNNPLQFDMLSSGPAGVAALPSWPTRQGPGLYIHHSILGVSFLHFILSQSLSVWAGSASAGIKFSKTLSVSPAIRGGPRHQTRESSTDFS